MNILSEVHLEQAALDWLRELGWSVAHGPDISPPDGQTPGTERDTYRQVVLKGRLREAIRRLNPDIPPGAQDDALRLVLNPNISRPCAGEPAVPPLARGRCAGGVSTGRGNPGCAGTAHRFRRRRSQ